VENTTSSTIWPADTARDRKIPAGRTAAGTGGGNHVVIGGATPETAPFCGGRSAPQPGRLLAEPSSLSYLFSDFSSVDKPTSARGRSAHDSLYELAIAFSQVPDADSQQHINPGRGPHLPQPVDRLTEIRTARNLYRQLYPADAAHSGWDWWNCERSKCRRTRA